jgi:hypothetical protein
VFQDANKWWAPLNKIIFGFHKRRGISLRAERLLDSKNNLYVVSHYFLVCNSHSTLYMASARPSLRR